VPRALCEKLPTYASPLLLLLLYVQEIEPHTGWHLGNFARPSRTWRSFNACVHLIREDRAHRRRVGHPHRRAIHQSARQNRTIAKPHIKVISY
jgi:hypothetical protein